MPGRRSGAWRPARSGVEKFAAIHRETMEVVRDGLSGAAERPASREWLDSFHGAEWPALPLPADTEYRADLHQRVEKLRAFLAGHLPTDDENGREAVEEGGEGRVCVYASPPRHFRARCRFALNRDDDGQLVSLSIYPRAPTCFACALER